MKIYNRYFEVIAFRKSDDHYQLKDIVTGKTTWFIHASNLIPVPAKEVVIDFGNGICGTIEDSLYNNESFNVVNKSDEIVAEIRFDLLTELMKSTVLALLARIEYFMGYVI